MYLALSGVCFEATVAHCTATDMDTVAWLPAATDIHLCQAYLNNDLRLMQ